MGREMDVAHILSFAARPEKLGYVKRGENTEGYVTQLSLQQQDNDILICNWEKKAYRPILSKNNDGDLKS